MKDEDIKVIKSLVKELNDITKHINTLEGFEAKFRATIEVFSIKITKNNQYVFACSTALTEENLREKINTLKILVDNEWK